MSRATDTAVTAIGMVTPVGSDAAQTFSSVRAGLRRMRERGALYACLPEQPDLDPRTPLVASGIEHLDPTPREEGRVAEWLAILAGHAFADLLRRACLTERDEEGLAVLLALPAAAGLDPGARDEVVYHFHNHAEHDLLPRLELAFGGNAAGLGLVERAAALLRDRRASRVAVGGVDSWLFRPRLAAADEAWRLLSERNVDGFQPGEAAAFVLLEARGEAERRGVAPLARVGASGAARAEGTAATPVTGVGLAEALARVLPDGPPLVLCDLNGERWRTKEWGWAVARLGARLPAGFAVEHPASALGDVGAASGALFVALATGYLATKHADRAAAVVWAASDDGERRALALARA